jgi:hypothetical protein
MIRPAAAVLLMVLSLSSCGRRDVAAVNPVRARQVERGILPAGTTVVLRVVGRITAGTASPEQGFGAVVAGDVHDSSGHMIVSSGAPARLVIHPEGLALSAVMIYGAWRAVGPASGADRAVGGGALLGTLTRGVIETPPAGTSVTQSMAIRTTGPDVQVPAGTLLIFRLDEPAKITGSADVTSPRSPRTG